MSDGQTTAKVGDRLTYAVSVRNVGTSGAPHLTITLTLPEGVPLISATPHGTAAVQKITWHAGLAVGRAESFRATGRVAHSPTGMLRLAAVACASAKGGSKPVVCAADLDQSAGGAAAAAQGPRPAAPGDGSAVGYTAGGLAVLTASALVIFIGRRNRSSRRMRHSG